ARLPAPRGRGLLRRALQPAPALVLRARRRIRAPADDRGSRAARRRRPAPRAADGGRDPRRQRLRTGVLDAAPLAPRPPRRRPAGDTRCERTIPPRRTARPR